MTWHVSSGDIHEVFTTVFQALLHSKRGRRGEEALRGRTLQNISSLKITLGLLQQSLLTLTPTFTRFSVYVEQSKEVLETHFKRIPRHDFTEGSESSFFSTTPLSSKHLLFFLQVISETLPLILILKSYFRSFKIKYSSDKLLKWLNQLLLQESRQLSTMAFLLFLLNGWCNIKDLLLQKGKCTQDHVRKEDLVNIFFTISGKDKWPYLLIAAF